MTRPDSTATYQRPRDYWCNDDEQVRIIEAALDCYEASLRAAPPISDARAVADKLRELCDRLDWQGPSREANIRLTVSEARVLLASPVNDSAAHGSSKDLPRPDLSPLSEKQQIAGDGGSSKRTDERIIKARQMLYEWRLGDSADHYNLLRDLDELLAPSPDSQEQEGGGK